VAVVAVAAVALAACGGSSSSSNTTTSTSGAGSTIPRNVVVPLGTVHRYFPDITREASTGPNSSAVGKPTGTRVVVYTNSDGSRKLTLSVDQYGSSSDATAAYQQAVQGSQAAPGAKPAPAPNLGQQSFAGTSQVGAEMHFGLGAVDGRLIVAATYAGYPVTPDNSAKLVAVGGQELATAKQVLGSTASS
jgi:hypothetical protein